MKKCPKCAEIVKREVEVCRFCGYRFSSKPLSQGEEEGIVKEKCYNHPERDALSRCHLCGRYFCSECLTKGVEYYYCHSEQCQVALQSELKKIEESKPATTTETSQPEKTASDMKKDLRSWGFLAHRNRNYQHYTGRDSGSDLGRCSHSSWRLDLIYSMARYVHCAWDSFISGRYYEHYLWGIWNLDYIWCSPDLLRSAGDSQVL